jgi:outer membrane biosynthesis protein TonB
LEERRSYWSFAGSTALHGALLALILLGFASARRFADSPEAIPIETVSLSELNQIANGEKNAKPAPQPAPAPPPDLRASTEPTPPEPTPPPQPDKAEAAPTPPKAETPPPTPTPPPKADAAPEPKPLPPERPEPPPPPKLAIQDAPVEPPVRPKFIDASSERPKEPAPEKPKPSHYFDQNAIAKLIGQGKMATAAPPQTAATATPQGLPHHDAPHMSMSMASALDAWLTESYLNGSGRIHALFRTMESRNHPFRSARDPGMTAVRPRRRAWLLV